MITKFGKRFLISYLAGNVDFVKKDIALGIGSTAANAKGNDTRLQFEFYRLPATLGSIDIQQTGVDGDGDPVFSYAAIYMATIPQDIAGVISEVGLYPGSRTSYNNFDSKFITTFENNLNWSDGTYNPQLQMNDTALPFLSKIGESMIKIQAVSGTPKEHVNSLITYDISGYSVNDTLAIAYKKADTLASKIRVKFYSSNSDYYYMDYTPESGTGDKISSKTMNNLFSNQVGTPDPTSIIKVGVEVTASSGTTTVYFDGLRVNDEDTFDPTYGMISRSALSTELVKLAGRQVDIEYRLDLSI